MAEQHIDIRHHRSKHLSEFLNQPFDDVINVITVCDQAAETCPVFPGRARRTRWSFPDPAAVDGGQTDRLTDFREVRDAIETRLRAWLPTVLAEDS